MNATDNLIKNSRNEAAWTFSFARNERGLSVGVETRLETSEVNTESQNVLAACRTQTFFAFPPSLPLDR